MLSDYDGNSGAVAPATSGKAILVNLTGTGVNRANNETPAGAISGTDGTDGNAVFTLTQTPDPSGSLQLFKTDVGTAVLMIETVHFNLAGNTITYTAGNIPIVGQTHRAWYNYT